MAATKTYVALMRGINVGGKHLVPMKMLAEMFAAKHGLGFLIINAMQLLQTEEMITVAVVVFAFAAFGNALLLWLEHRLHHRA